MIWQPPPFPPPEPNEELEARLVAARLALRAARERLAVTLRETRRLGEARHERLGPPPPPPYNDPGYG